MHHHIYIPEANISRYIPSELAECDAKEYINICELLYLYQSNQIAFMQFKVAAVYRLLKMKEAKHPLLPTQILDESITEEDIKASNIYELTQLIDTFFEDQEGVKVIKQNYLTNPVPTIRPSLIKYHGPADNFHNLTFGEYLDALRLFNDFHSCGDPEILYLLVAILYRPAAPFHFLQKDKGDIREVYNSHTIEKRAKKLKYAPFGFIYGVYLLFASFQKALVEMKLNWGGKELDLSILFDSSETQDESNELPGIGMDALAFTMAESGAFGDYEALRLANFWQIIVRMYDMRKSDLERQKHESNATTK